MMNLFTKYKNVITVVVLLAVGFFVYSSFFKPDATSTLTAADVNPAQTAVEQELIALLLELRSIRLDLSLFDDPAFQSLSDFSQELVSEPVGRPNPFLPLQ